MTDTSPDLVSVIRNAIRSALIDVHIALPGRVESYDSVAQTADVKPMLKRVLRRADMSRIAEELPVIPCVPVLWSRGGGAFASLPLTAGDFGWISFGDYSIDRFRSTGDDVDPGDERRFDLANAVFLPNGPFPSSNTLADADASEVRFGFDSDYVVAIKKGPMPEIRLPRAAVTFLARADRVLTELGKIVTGFNTHVHVETGASTNVPTVLLGTALDPASDTVKGT